VDADLWRDVQAILDGRTLRGQRARQTPALLAGFLYAGDTDYRLYVHRRDGVAYYRIAHDVPHPFVSCHADAAEAFVAAELKTISLADETEAAALAARAAHPAPAAARRRAELERDLADLRAEMVETARDHARKRIDGVTFDAVYAAQQADAERLSAQLAALPTAAELAAPRAILDARIGIAERIDAALATGKPERLRALVETFIERVNVYDSSPPARGRAAAKWRAEHPPRFAIRWNPRAFVNGD
jgi:hypothetical protein